MYSCRRLAQSGRTEDTAQCSGHSPDANSDATPSPHRNTGPAVFLLLSPLKSSFSKFHGAQIMGPKSTVGLSNKPETFLQERKKGLCILDRIHNDVLQR